MSNYEVQSQFKFSAKKIRRLLDANPKATDLFINVCYAKENKEVFSSKIIATINGGKSLRGDDDDVDGCPMPPGCPD